MCPRAKNVSSQGETTLIDSNLYANYYQVFVHARERVFIFHLPYRSKWTKIFKRAGTNQKKENVFYPFQQISDTLCIISLYWSTNRLSGWEEKITLLCWQRNIRSLSMATYTMVGFSRVCQQTHFPTRLLTSYSGISLWYHTPGLIINHRRILWFQQAHPLSGVDIT